MARTPKFWLVVVDDVDNTEVQKGTIPLAKGESQNARGKNLQLKVKDRRAALAPANILSRRPAEDLAEEPFPVQGIGPFVLLHPIYPCYCGAYPAILGILVAGARPAVIRATMYI
eukprot:s1613_g31.t1